MFTVKSVIKIFARKSTVDKDGSLFSGSVGSIEYQRNEARLFAQQCYETIARTTDYPWFTVIRDYAYIPSDINVHMAKQQLRKLIRENKIMFPFVSVWVTNVPSGKLVLYWCIDNPMCIV